MSAPQTPTGATPGPWRVCETPSSNCGTDWRDVVTDALPFAPSFVCAALANDAALIARAPDLIAEVESLRVEVARLRAALASK
jgi:hypothetical protein